MKTGHKENFGKEFQVPADSHSLLSGLEKFNT